jgi:CDP-diacylglycerol--glycerol-3-phosphate 3-phosphatidyltransferase/cardiolipin synthase
MRLNIPTILTLGRVAVIPLVLALFYIDWAPARHVAAALFIVAALTDWLDGYLARLWKQTSNFGAFLDPVADKLLVAVALVMLLRFGPQKPLLSLLVAVIIGREITISALREWLAELGQRGRVSVGLLGKLKTVSQMTAIGLMLWETPLGPIPVYDLGYVLLFLASALTIWSMIVYLRAAWPVMRDSP